MSTQRSKFAISSIKSAGRLLIELSKGRVQIGNKNNDIQDVVTDVDIKISSFLSQKIQAAFPGELIYSEESPNVDLSSGTFWSIDPIDGTTCFARGIPHFAIVIAYVEKGSPQIGAIYNPITKELFSFEKK